MVNSSYNSLGSTAALEQYYKPLIDTFYKRMLNFVHRCLTSESPLVCSFIRQAILHNQADSITGRNVLNCCFQYNVKIDEIMTLTFRHHNIDKLVITQSDDNTAIADWLIELLLCRDGDGMLHLAGSDFDADDLLSLINSLCTY